MLIATDSQKERLRQFQQEVESASVMRAIEAGDAREIISLYCVKIMPGQVSSTRQEAILMLIYCIAVFAAADERSWGKTFYKQSCFSTERQDGLWHVHSKDEQIKGRILINAAGAWADQIGYLAGAETIGLVPKGGQPCSLKQMKGLI